MKIWSSTLFFLLSLDIQAVIGSACKPRGTNNSTGSHHHTIKKPFSSNPSSIISVYYPSYNSKFLPVEKIPWKNYNHLHYFVAEPSQNPKQDLKITDEKNLLDVVSGAKSHNVSISLSIGGWTGSRTISSLVKTRQSRHDFAESLKRAVNKYKLDGIDMDWEYPNLPGIGCNIINKDDTSHFLEFLKVLRAKLGPSSRLSAAVSVQGFMSSDGVHYVNDTSGFARQLDFITIMAYDIYGPSFSELAGPNAPLYDTCSDPTNKFSVARAIKQWTSTGMPSHKILLGLPTYGYGYTTLSNQLNPTNFASSSSNNNNNNNKIKSNLKSFFFQPTSSVVPPAGQTSDPGGVKDQCGNINQPGGQWLFKELYQTGKLSLDGLEGLGGYQRIYDNCTHTPLLFNPKNRNLISYDDPISLSEKTTYALQHGLGGVDVFDATGDSEDGQLLSSIRKAILNHHHHRL